MPRCSLCGYYHQTWEGCSADPSAEQGWRFDLPGYDPQRLELILPSPETLLPPPFPVRRISGGAEGRDRRGDEGPDRRAARPRRFTARMHD